jgi:hypothetical protein
MVTVMDSECRPVMSVREIDSRLVIRLLMATVTDLRWRLLIHLQQLSMG